MDGKTILELSWAGDEIEWTVGDLKKTFKSSDPAAKRAREVGDQLCSDLGYLKPYLVAYKEAIHEAAVEQGQTETETFPALCVELVDKTLEALKEDKNEDAPPHPFPITVGGFTLPLHVAAQAHVEGDEHGVLSLLPSMEFLKEFPAWLLKGCDDGMEPKAYKRAVAANILAHPDVQDKADELSKSSESGAGAGRGGLSSLLALNIRERERPLRKGAR